MIEYLLGVICGILIAIYIECIRIRRYLNPFQPVNAYGETFPDAIQNSIVRGQRGVSTYD